jgi:hypothetical protein
MTFYAKSDSPIAPVDKPPEGGGDPPLVIWGPGDPRPTLPIAGWNPGSGAWPEPPDPPVEPPPEINIDPMPSQPIAEPPWGWGNPPPKPDVPAAPGWKVMYGWTPETGWFVFAIPTGPVPTPSGKRR